LLEQEVKKRDLDIFISFGFILNGPLEDFVQARNLLRTLPRSRIIYHTGSSRRLFIVKEKKPEEEEKIEQEK